MIALLTGKIVSKQPNELILDVSGVGYHIFTTVGTYEAAPKAGDATTLHIYTYVREDALLLYGFHTREEKDLFVKLLKVSGIGPKMAVSILSGMLPRDFVSAVRNEDIARLNAIPGVGRKTAERIIIDLKDKLLGFAQGAATADKRTGRMYDDAISALVNLGYNKLMVEKALAKTGVSSDNSLSNIIRSALKELSSI